MPLPTKDALEKKIKDIDKAKTYEFSDEQIDQVKSIDPIISVLVCVICTDC